MLRLLPAAVLLTACTNSACPEGSFQTAGGECIEGEMASLAWEDGVIDGIPTRECVLREPTGELDFIDACAMGGCVGDTYEELIDAWGVGADCNDFSYTVSGELVERVGCDWQSGLGMHFDASGNNPDLTDPGDVFTVEPPFRGASADGLSVGVSLGCFAERYGQPTEIGEFESDGQRQLPQRIYYRTDDFRAIMYDSGLLGNGQLDGIIDYMLIFPVN